MENLEYVIKKKNGEIISINVEEIESMYYRNVENGTDSLLDSNVEDGSASPLKFAIISNTEAAVVYDEPYKNFHHFDIPPKVRIKGRVYDVRTIESSAFRDCYKLTSIDIPNSVSKIEEHAFNGCVSLESINIPNSVTSIRDRTFWNCSSISSIEIPNSVTEIGESAFRGCSLTSIEIPDSVTSIGNGVFSYCPKLESIDVDSNNPNYSSEDGVLYNKDKTTLIKVPKGKKGIYEMPYSVKEIESNAFENNEYLTKIVISRGVKEIKDKTFYECISLTDIIIPASVANIGAGAFSHCTSLTNITIPASVTYIGYSAFENCTNLDVYIDNVEDNVEIKETAFKNCKSVKFLH